jgi:hypothetical protein
VLEEGTAAYADRVANEIGPQESKAQDEATERCAPEHIDPLSVIELADLNQVTHPERRQRTRPNPATR